MQQIDAQQIQTSNATRLMQSGVPKPESVDLAASSHNSNIALEQFLVSVEKDAYRLILAACKNPDDAVDLVQEAMLQLVTRYSHKPESEWRPLFHRIVQNRIRDWYRKRCVKHALLRWTGLGDTTEQLASIAAPSQSGPMAIVDSHDELKRINSAVEQLPLRQQQVFLLRAWQEMTVQETAQAMQISAGSVKTHYSRALNTMRELLGGDGDDSEK